MHQQKSLLIVLVLLLNACATSSPTNTNAVKSVESVYWVNGKQADCAGKDCLEMQKGEFKNPQNWEAFAEPIEGFSYEKGYVYKLLINEEKLTADKNLGNSYASKFKLVRVIEKAYEPKLLLNDKWTLEKINSNIISTNNLPTIEFNLDLKKMSASDGCNIYVGEIKSVMENHIYLGNVIGTKRLCEDMGDADAYPALLSQINSYKIEGNKLLIYDKENNEILSFTPTN
jgi:heat shock protein HslJ